MIRNETCQVIIDTTQITQKMNDTIQSNFESIQTKSEKLMNRFKHIMKRFILESIQSEDDTNHKKSEGSIQFLTNT